MKQHGWFEFMHDGTYIRHVDELPPGKPVSTGHPELLNYLVPAVTVENVRDAVFAHMHEEIGVCGHCGTRKCAGRKGHSKLPESIPLDTLVAAFNLADGSRT